MDLRELAVTSSAAGRHPWELARADAVQFLLQVRAGLPARPAVLDFGCGDTFLVSRIARGLGAAEAYAVDRAFTPDLKSQLIEKYPDVSLFDSLPALEEAEKPEADLVLLLDVLEHCEDDLAVLDSLMESPAVSLDAKFLITVPAFQGLFSKHDDFLGHYRRYSLGQLTRVVREAGLEVLESSYFFSSLLLPRAVQVALERLSLSKAEPKGLGDYQGNAGRDAAIRGVLRADFRVCQALARVGIRIPGLSCYVLAGRNSRGESGA